MRKIIALLAGAMLMIATSAMALPAIPQGYNWINAPFWTNTDSTTPPANGTSNFALTFEQAAFESDFGLFSVKSTGPNQIALDAKFEIFKYLQEPINGMFGPETTATVYFKNDGSVSLDGQNFTAFNKTFGFYFDVHTGGAGDPTADYSYYTYNPFNQPNSESGVEHVFTAFNSTSHQVLIFLDDQLIAQGSDRDADDMVVYGNDLTPVPEPGTMVLLGIGMFGLAIYGKRRMNKEA